MTIKELLELPRGTLVRWRKDYMGHLFDEYHTVASVAFVRGRALVIDVNGSGCNGKPEEFSLVKL